MFVASAATFLYTRKHASADLIDLLRATSMAGLIVLLDVFVIFLNFQLDSQSFNESWKTVFAPFFIVLGILFLWVCGGLFVSVRKCIGTSQPYKYGALVGWTVIGFYTIITLFIFCGCLISKLSDGDSMNWWSVFGSVFAWTAFLAICDVFVAIGHVVYAQFHNRSALIRKYLWCGGPDLYTAIM